MRLIDVDEVFCEDCNLKSTKDCKYCDVHDMPTVDAVEVVHGKWIKISESCGIDVLECSVCHGVHPRYATSFCCDCGARMDEVSE